ncbi:chemotaxis protein [Pararhodobacter marinus]|uniref:Chemotaxis protein n=1 Tax=Pararhodobacter marinus TaxID=2184063 RepID=A0A2U2C6R7_9RHOB|nr:CheR family methyltransferase [Pararhodobacter marinus]PWE27553.1 chemotaxis protein [Pararhodobacter marinus]
MNDQRPDFPIVGIGASAGGLEALRDMLEGFSGDAAMALVVIQHLDPNHESMMAQLIDRYTSMPVTQISGGERVEPGHVYVIPPGRNLSIRNGVLELHDFDAPRGMRRPIDDFFEILGVEHGRRAAGVILSGTGADGSRGIRAIKEHGGLAVVQEPADARYDGMPLAAEGTGLVDFVRPARDLLSVISNFFRHDAENPVTDPTAQVADYIDDLCIALNDATGHDFAGYKRSTLSRRIQRRMQVLGIAEGGDYVTRVRSDPAECQTLFRDLLINVTRFFRDSEAFTTLAERAIDPLVREASDSDELRIWVAGCSSGEEAYSIAMLFRDAMTRHKRYPVVNIFASDIDERMLDIAREGTYPLSALADVPEPFRTRFTTASGDHFSIVPQIRDMVRFSAHSLIKDPPFSRIDLVSCRNLLIYLDENLQRAVMPLMHYALRQDGYLFLGSSETIGRFDDLFDEVNHRHRLFRRRSVRLSYPLNLPNGGTRRNQAPGPQQERDTKSLDWLESEALQQMTQRYAPPTLLVDSAGGIINTWGPVGRYFDFPSERERRQYAPSLAKPGLRDVLGPLVRQTSGDRRAHIVKDVTVRADFGTQPVRVICEPVRDNALLIVIRETGGFQTNGEEDYVELRDGDSQVHLMENELRVMRHRLRSTVEELETANEELKSSNEEMMSMNEELQSTNEELTTVNDELKSKVDQLTVANADLKNFFDSTQLAVIVVDRHMQIRSFTDAAMTLFPFQPGDRGRSLADVTSPLGTTRYLDHARKVAETGETIEDRMRDEQRGLDFAVRVMPYRLLDGAQDGATLIFTDITASLSLERALKDERARLALAIEVAKVGIWSYNPITGYTELDETEREFFSLSDDEPSDLAKLMDRVNEEDRDAVTRSLTDAAANKRNFDESFRVTDETGETRWLRGLGRFVLRDGDPRVMGVTFDISAEHRMLEERELHLAEMNHRIKNLFAVVSAMISSVERESESTRDFSKNLRGRISALDRAHALMLRDNMRAPIPLLQLLDRVLEPARGGQTIRIEGPDTLVPVRELTPLVLILHEWSTNSAKYGALSDPNGTLKVDWTNGDQEFRIVWEESIEAFEESDTGPGFGSRLVQASVMQLGADLKRDVSDELLRLTLSMPAFTTPDDTDDEE